MPVSMTYESRVLNELEVIFRLKARSGTHLAPEIIASAGRCQSSNAGWFNAVAKKSLVNAIDSDAYQSGVDEDGEI
jgi:hypothetical protein